MTQGDCSSLTYDREILRDLDDEDEDDYIDYSDDDESDDDPVMAS